MATEYGLIDLGKATFGAETAAGGEATLSGLPIKEIASVTPKFEHKQTLGEEVQLRQRYVVTSGALYPKSARVIQQGVVGIDLTGNITIDVEVDVADDESELAIARVDGLYDAAGSTAQDSTKTSVVFTQTKVPALLNVNGSEQPIILCYSLEYEMRHVAAGADTITEGDDRVVSMSGADPCVDDSNTHKQEDHCVTLIEPADLRVSSWAIQDTGAPDWKLLSISRMDSREPAQYSYATYGTDEFLYFDSLEEAWKLVRWVHLQTMRAGGALRLGGAQLSLCGEEDECEVLDKAHLPRLRVVRINWNWEPSKNPAPATQM